MNSKEKQSNHGITAKKLFSFLLMAFVISGCGPKLATGEAPQDPNELEDGGFEYTFGTPQNFKVGEADLGATISWDPNPTVEKYHLYMGLDENLEGIPQATENGFENPLDVEDANIIRITSGSLDPSTEYCFAAKAYNSEGEASDMTDVKCLTVRDLIGVEVAYKAKMSACIAGDNRALFSFKEGKLIFTHNDDNELNRFPGHGGNKCLFDGVHLELQKMVDGAVSGPVYHFPPLSENQGRKVMNSIGDSIDLTESISSDFANLITDEPMTVGLDGQFKKVCQGGILSKVRVKSRDESGPVEDNDPINTLEFDITKCAKNNWFTFHDDKNSAIEFNLFFQTAE